MQNLECDSTNKLAARLRTRSHPLSCCWLMCSCLAFRLCFVALLYSRGSQLFAPVGCARYPIHLSWSRSRSRSPSHTLLFSLSLLLSLSDSLDPSHFSLTFPADLHVCRTHSFTLSLFRLFSSSPPSALSHSHCHCRCHIPHAHPVWYAISCSILFVSLNLTSQGALPHCGRSHARRASTFATS